MMMREIKCRGFNAKNKQWIYGFYLQNRGQNFVCPDEPAHDKSWEDYEVKEGSVGQFTGIKDEMGREIYEGDVIKIDGCPELGNLVVVFYEAAFALATPKEYLLLQHGEHPFLNDYGRLASLGDFDYRGLHRVIGNVIENPELYKYESV